MKFVQMYSRNSIHKRIAIVQSTTNKSIRQGDSRIKIKQVSDTSNVSNVVVTVFDNIVNMKLIIKFIIKGYTKITSFGSRTERISQYIHRKINLNLVTLLLIANEHEFSFIRV